MKKKELYIHIGIGKTGTTALQKFFWQNRRILEKKGISYPNIGVKSGAHHLLSPHIMPSLQDVWKFKEVNEWSPEIDKIEEDRILLSSELMIWAKAESIVKFCKELKTKVDLKIIIYLRRQDNLIMAGYNQMVKSGHQKRDIHDSVEELFKKFNFPDITETWVKAVGKKNIIVRPYEKQQFYKGNLYADFMLHVFGEEIDSKFKINDKNTNPRLPIKVLEYKRLLNNIVDDTGLLDSANKALMNYSSSESDASTTVFSNTTLLPPPKRIDILRRSENANKMIANEYLGRDGGKLFYEPWPDVNDDWQSLEFSSDEFAEVSNYIKKINPGLMNAIVESANKHKGSSDILEKQSAELIIMSIDLK